MKKLIICGDPGVRRDGVTGYDGEEYVLFSVDRQGDWCGSDRVQLRRAAGTKGEREAFERRKLTSHQLETEGVDVEAIEVVRERGVA